jgi:UDP-N-acetylglucosamine 2-epimerase (non-hydrolysing)
MSFRFPVTFTIVKPKVVFVVGTRPDSIKTLPVALEMKRRSEVETVLVSTGQHREMLDQVFETFGIQPDLDLNLMKHGQSLSEMSSRMLSALDSAFSETNSSYIVAQGDTTTTFIASLVAFYQQTPFGHIEAGLRTYDVTNPFPEEFNRQATSLITRHHFAPTVAAARNLQNERIEQARIYVTGNTGIDAVLHVARQTEQTWYKDSSEQIILMTMHRRENWGEPMREVATSILEIVEAYTQTRLVVPMHRNPVVREVLHEILGSHPRIDLIEPPAYESFVKLMERASWILTDSGGVQEEAPSFGKPLLVLRETTERPEGVQVGCAKLIGTSRNAVLENSRKLMDDAQFFSSMSTVQNPYGDGKASARICDVICKFLVG